MLSGRVRNGWAHRHPFEPGRPCPSMPLDRGHSREHPAAPGLSQPSRSVPIEITHAASSMRRPRCPVTPESCRPCALPPVTSAGLIAIGGHCGWSARMGCAISPSPASSPGVGARCLSQPIARRRHVCDARRQAPGGRGPPSAAPAEGPTCPDAPSPLYGRGRTFVRVTLAAKLRPLGRLQPRWIVRNYDLEFLKKFSMVIGFSAGHTWLILAASTSTTSSRVIPTRRFASHRSPYRAGWRGLCGRHRCRGAGLGQGGG